MKVAALLLMCLSSALATYNTQGTISFSAPQYQGSMSGTTRYQTFNPTFHQGRTYVTGAAPAYDYGANLGLNGGNNGFMAQVNPGVSSGLNYGSLSTGYTGNYQTGINYGFQSPSLYTGNYQTGINYGFQSPSLYSADVPTYGATGGYSSVAGIMPAYTPVGTPGYSAVGPMPAYTPVGTPGYSAVGPMPAYTSVGMTASPSYSYGMQYTTPAYTSVGTPRYSAVGTMPAYTSVGTPGYSAVGPMPAYTSVGTPGGYSSVAGIMPGGYSSVAGAMPNVGGYSYGMSTYQPAVGSGAMMGAAGPIEYLGATPAFGYDPLTAGAAGFMMPGANNGFMGGFQQPIGGGIGGIQQTLGGGIGGIQQTLGGVLGGFQQPFGTSMGGINSFQYGIPGAY